MTPKYFHFFDRAGFGLGLLVLAMLAGCVDTPPWGGTSKHPTTAQTQTALGRQDNYVYFPGYEIYYNSNHGQYVYWDGSAWVTRTELPRGVSVEVLLASPSVAMNFHDAPEWHHAAMVRSYPRNWGRPEAIMVSAR